jgi:signal transduction histidine kinase
MHRAAGPDIQLVGPLDTVVDDFIIGDVEAVLRESLINVAKHGQAAKIRVLVQADGQRFALTVTDDGIGLGQSTRRSGLANLQRRAERYGGDFSVGDAPEGGCGCNGRSHHARDERQADPSVHL